MAELKYSPEQYHKRFNPTAYLNVQCLPRLRNSFRFFLREEHKFWSKFADSLPTNTNEVRCLEYGGGPSRYHLISAAPKVDRIVFAEFTEANRNEVLSWIAGGANANTNTHLFEYVVGELEGNTTKEAVLKRKEELKRKIKSVVPCDIHQSPIVSLEKYDCGKLFDVVSTSLCLEVCVDSEQEYKSAVAKLRELIKPNGYLRMSGVLKETWYSFGNETFYAFPLRKALIEEAMHEAGFQDINIVLQEEDKTDVVSNRKALYHVFGRKSDRE